MAYLLLAIAIISEVTATSALRLCEGFTRPLPSLVVIAGYGISFFSLSQVVKVMPLGYAYALWCGFGI
ncbi:MAG TPA: SMR family transporter, partial [Acidocella sp.]|nr:SMR family transporter [Acidocella sp.]